MGENDWFQKILYGIMAVLGGYILWKGGAVLLQSRMLQTVLDEGEVQRMLEDGALDTYVPGYTAAVRGGENGSWMAGWMSQIAPVYSYLAGGEGETENAFSEGQASEHMEGTEEIAGTAGNPEGEMESAFSEGQASEHMEGTGEIAGTDENPEYMEGTGEIAGTNENTEEIMETAGTSENTAETGIAEPAGETIPEEETESVAASSRLVSEEVLEELGDFHSLLSQYYTLDSGTTVGEELLNAEQLLREDLTLEQNPQAPQILIYHTHSQEMFIDSREGKTEDSIVGMGEVLAEELRDRYGYCVIHDTGVYDLVDGVLDRSAAYDYARASVERILEEHPSIEVIIDLHRDGVEGRKFVTEIDGKPTSMIMFFNGLSRNERDEPLYWLENPYIQQNLAFSLQMQVKAREQYPGFTRNIYLKAERFNLHLRPRSLLVEAGTQLNTVEEEKNAMIPLAELLHQVLSGT